VTELARPTQLLDELAKNGAYDNGLHLKDPNITYEQLEAVGHMLGRHHSDVRLAMGDYLLLAETLFPEKFSQAAEALNISEDGMLEYLRVARAVPRSVRVKNPTISWSHYRAVASLKVVDEKTGEVSTDHKAQKQWLKKAAENHWSHHKFRAELKPTPEEPLEEPNVCRCCHRAL
jgi:hypothetical protein